MVKHIHHCIGNILKSQGHHEILSTEVSPLLPIEIHNYWVFGFEIRAAHNHNWTFQFDIRACSIYCRAWVRACSHNWAVGFQTRAARSRS